MKIIILAGGGEIFINFEFNKREYINFSRYIYNVNLDLE